MTPRSKSILLIVATLVIGGLIGALVHARLSEARIERISAYRSDRGFIRFVERGIGPTDDRQQEEIRRIVSSAADRAADVSMRHREEMRAIMDSTRSALFHILTPEQMERLRQHLAGRPRGRGGPGRHRGGR